MNKQKQIPFRIFDPSIGTSEVGSSHINLQKNQFIQLNEKPSLFLFLGGLILVVVFVSLSKRVYIGGTIFHFKPFFQIFKLIGHKKTIVFHYSHIFLGFTKKYTFSTQLQCKNMYIFEFFNMQKLIKMKNRYILEFFPSDISLK